MQAFEDPIDSFPLWLRAFHRPLGVLAVILRLRVDGRNASYAPEPTQDVGSENGNTRAGGYAGESFLCAGVAMCEVIAANHNRNQACHLRNGSGEEGLQRGEPCVKRRARLRVSSYGKEQH